MFDCIFKRRETPLTLSEIACLRAWLRTSPLPRVPYAGALPPTPEQALLLFSLTYAAGVRKNELAQMRVDALLDENGSPSDYVRIRQQTTRHRVSRRVAMHPEIRRDLLAFKARHPEKSLVAFVAYGSGEARHEAMSTNALSFWFRRALAAAEAWMTPGPTELPMPQGGHCHG
jgi:integrase